MTENDNNSEDRLNWVSIDFDDVLAQNTGHPDYIPTEPIKGAREALESLYLLGWHIVIYTARSWHDYDMIAEWLDNNAIPYDQVICGKVFSKWNIDDRNIPFDGDWEKTLKLIK